MILKIYFTNYINMKFNNVNPNSENVVAINLELFHVFFFKIVEIDLKIKHQSFFCVEFFQVLAKLDLSHLSPHLLEWNVSKLLIFTKI